MKYAEALEIANTLVDTLRPACERIEIAGSLRRKKPDVKDIEIVFIPKVEQLNVGLFAEDSVFAQAETVDRAAEAIERLVELGVVQPDKVVRRWGPKYKRVIEPETSVVVELFAAEWHNWGYIFALRTGPAEWNQILVKKRKYGGALPAHLDLKDGWLTFADGDRLSTSSEEEFFDELGLPLIPPEQRTGERIKMLLWQQARDRPQGGDSGT